MPSSITTDRESSAVERATHFASRPSGAPEHIQPDEDDQEDQYLISCRCESAKVISTLLSCLKHVTTASSRQGSANTTIRSSMSQRRSHGSNASRLVSSSSHSAASLQPVTVFCSPTSLTFHICNTSKQIQASVDINASFFSDYSVATTSTMDDGEDDHMVGGEFCLNLSTLLECLHSLGTHNLDKTKLCFSFNSTQDIFKLELLEESGILSTATIPGMMSPHLEDDETDEDDPALRHNALAHSFQSSPISARMIVKSDSLRELVSEIDYVTGGTMAVVSLGLDGFKIRVVGFLGECQIVLPPKGHHVVCIEVRARETTRTSDVASRASSTGPKTWTYPLHSFLESMRGLDIADETCITMNTAGMMAIQHQVLDPTVSDTPSFVDFILCCMQDEEDDDETAVTDSASADMQHASPVPVPNHRVSAFATQDQASIVSQTNPDLNAEDSDDASPVHPRVRGASSDRRLFGVVDAAENPPAKRQEAPRRRPRSNRSAHPNKKNRFSTIVQKEMKESEKDVSSDAESDDDDEMDGFSSYAARSHFGRHRRRPVDQDGGCSSPELVYGKQH